MEKNGKNTHTENESEEIVEQSEDESTAEAPEDKDCKPTKSELEYLQKMLYGIGMAKYNNMMGGEAKHKNKKFYTKAHRKARRKMQRESRRRNRSA